jgi:hypothetical protein
MYRIVVQDGKVQRLKDRLNDPTLHTQSSTVRTGESLRRIEVDVMSLNRIKEVEELIRAEKTDIIGEYEVIGGSRSEVEEKRSAYIAKTALRFVLSYLIVFASIIITMLGSDYDKLASGMFPWWLVFLVSIPSAFGNVYGVEKTKPR